MGIVGRWAAAVVVAFALGTLAGRTLSHHTLKEISRC